MALRDLLKNRRNELGLSYRKAQEVTRVAHTVIFQIERGDIKNPSFMIIVQLCKGYELSITKAVKEVLHG